MSVAINAHLHHEYLKPPPLSAKIPSQKKLQRGEEYINIVNDLQQQQTKITSCNTFLYYTLVGIAKSCVNSVKIILWIQPQCCFVIVEFRR